MGYRRRHLGAALDASSEGGNAWKWKRNIRLAAFAAA
jgi:hypothetical protein